MTTPILKVRDMEKIILGMHGCIQGRSRWSVDATRSSDHLHFKKIKKA
jgi:hypothetical protein